jgi:hypothetical protein
MQRLKLIQGRGPERHGLRLVNKEAPPLRLLPPGGGQRIIDLRRHVETYKGFDLEVWQIAETCGTARPRFYTVRYNLEAKTPTPRRDRAEFSELDAANRNVRRRADRWRYLLDKRPREAGAVRKPRRRLKSIGVPRERELIDRITAAPQAWESGIHAFIDPETDLPASVRAAIADAAAI